ncbi:putative membrane protein [Peptoniphilus sp. ING2-D1G]|nr:putative membrane protein [Peptoniphilus sp. ING2-D1G]
MKKRGFTYIVTIIIVTLIILGLSLLISNLKDELLIVKNQRDSIQADAYAESMINIALSDKRFTNCLEDIYHGKSKSMQIAPAHIIDELDSSKITLKLDNSIVKKGFLMTAEVEYKNINSRFFAQGSIVNPLYLKKLGVLNPRVIGEEEVGQLKDSFTKHPDESLSFVDYIHLEDKDYFIEKDGRYFVIYEENLQGEEPTRNIMARGLSTDSFYITQSGGSLCIVDEIRIRGIVDIDNILLNENLNIDGILVLRSNVNFLDNPKNIYVKGITVNTPSVSENNVISRYDFGEIDLYSRGISNYIKPRIYSIKRSIDNK